MAAGDRETPATLSLRKEPVGGPVDDQVPQAAIDALRQALNSGTARGLVLLVHGYNNDCEAARKSYEGFFDVQRELAQLPEGRALADNRVFAAMYWPGDADWGAASALFYMRALKNAVLSAQRFAAALVQLARRPDPLDVQIIGHSMGCRVALELLRSLAVPNLRVSRVVLMAGAVPTYMLEEAAGAGSLRAAYDAAIGGAGGALRSLYSSWDPVLAFAFPAGQGLAPGDEGILPTALGHEYWEAAVAPVGFTQGEVSHAKHSDYWGGESSRRAIALDAQRQVRDFLGFQSSAPRDTAAREVAAREDTPARDTPPARETA